MKKLYSLFFLTALLVTENCRASLHCNLVSTSKENRFDSKTLQPPNERLKALRNFLLNDNTDLHEYNSNTKNDQEWFVCNHFSPQLFLRSSSFAVTEKVLELEKLTPITFRNEGLPKEKRLPLYYVALANEEKGFYHAINAIYMGIDEKGTQDIHEYYFIEPQTDQIFENIELALNHYQLNSPSMTKISIGTFSEVGHPYSTSFSFVNEINSVFQCE